MKNLLLSFALSFLLVDCTPEKVFFEGAICIENINIIDPIDGLVKAQTVIIQSGKIAQVAPAATLHLSNENTIIDGTDQYLIPGLWDAHVHFAYIEELAPIMFDLFLTHGITSVRDTGGKISWVKKWKDAAEQLPTQAPRVKIAGPLLDGKPNVYDGSTPGRPPLSVGLGSMEEIKHQIQLLDSVEVDFLKAYEMLTPDQFHYIMQRATKLGLKVTGHVPLSMDVITASNAGLNSMEHLRNLELSCASNANELLHQRQELLEQGKHDLGGVLRSRIHQAQREVAIQNYDSTKAEEVLSVLASNQTWQIPTLALSTGFTKRPFADSIWMNTFKLLPDNIEQMWVDQITEFTKRSITPFQEEYTQWTLMMIKKIHEKGIDLMAGTDCPIFFLTPGYSLHEELAVFVEAGLSPLEALQTATINPARYFDLEHELGRIQENMLADLVILGANPLADIKNTLKINGVIKGGTYHDRKTLNVKLERLKNVDKPNIGLDNKSQDE